MAIKLYTTTLCRDCNTGTLVLDLFHATIVMSTHVRACGPHAERHGVLLQGLSVRADRLEGRSPGFTIVLRSLLHAKTIFGLQRSDIYGVLSFWGF